MIIIAINKFLLIGAYIRFSTTYIYIAAHFHCFFDRSNHIKVIKQKGMQWNWCLDIPWAAMKLISLVIIFYIWAPNNKLRTAVQNFPSHSMWGEWKSKLRWSEWVCWHFVYISLVGSFGFFCETEKKRRNEINVSFLKKVPQKKEKQIENQ